MKDSQELHVRTYYGLRLKLKREALHPLTVRALERIVNKHGDVVSFSALVDDMFGISSSVRASKVRTHVSLLRNELDEVCGMNKSLLKAGPSGPVDTHGYCLTDRAVDRIERKKTTDESRRDSK